MRFTRYALAAAALTAATVAGASSHREAPFITEMPKVDGTDFYMFRSYETNRSDFTTLIANYAPLQDAYGGPNYFSLDQNALYEIHVDNNGDSKEDLTFQFRFTNTYNPTKLNVGGNSVAIPLIVAGGVGPGASDTAALGVKESYTVTVVRGDRRGKSSTRELALNLTAGGGSTTFMKPVDNIGNKTIANYGTYADNHIFSIQIPGCAAPGKVFVGQRAEGFVVNLGEVFDLVALNPLGPRDGRSNIIADKNITSLALELPTGCLANAGDPVIGAWTTASVRQARVINSNPANPSKAAKQGGAWTQVSRLGSPLVNEVVIGLTDKDKFNSSEPKNDLANFGTYVQFPTLPELVKILFKVPTPATPRADLVAAFVTGITATVDGAPFKYTAPKTLTTPGEMLRLNTAIAPTAVANQQDLGFLACDLGGFPNGRRPIDDVVDIELTVVEGAIDGTNANKLQTCDVSNSKKFTVVNPGAVVNDGAKPVASAYLTRFPYLNTPTPGASSK